MPRPATKSRKKAPTESSGKKKPDIGIIVLLGLGLLLMLSLIRYTPSDLPVLGIGKAFTNSSEATLPRENLIGPVGALFGAFQLQLLGVIAYIVPPLMIWLGVALMMGARLKFKIIIGVGCMILFGAALHDVLNWFPTLKERFFLPSSGGWIGMLLGEGLLEKAFGSIGAGLVLICLYLIAMILTTGFHPIPFFKECYQRYCEWRIARTEAKAKRERLDPNARKARRRSKKPDEKSSEPDPTPASPILTESPKPTKENPEPQLPLRETPEPQIIDASQRRTPSADLGSKPFEKPKKVAAEGLSTEGFEDYELPGFDLLDYEDEAEDPGADSDTSELLNTQKVIVDTLRAFGVEVTAGDITRGPTITRYEIYPSLGLRVSRITQLESDLARATKAERINILAPIPGKDTVGIEIANDDKVAVPLRELLQDESFRSDKKKIPLALGKDVYGNTVIGDLAAMPHLLVAGATGSGKSVCINSIITSILFKFSPDELRFIMVDPKVVEMQVYSKLPHLVVPVVTDPKKVVAALRWTVNEMERRYKIFAKEGVRNFDSFNARPRPDKDEVPAEPEVEEENHEPVDPEHIESMARAFEDGDLGPPPINGEDDDEMDELNDIKIEDKLPYIVVIIDELADLMQTAPADVEMNIARIAQKARAAGIHLIVATQTPRADVVTGIIKANIPSRIAFQVSSALDSRVILDTKGADKLVGKGDMLFLPPGSAKLERSQGAFVSDEEVEKIVDHCSNQTEQKFEKSIQESIERGGGGDDSGGDDVSDADEELIQKCIEVIIQEQKASTSMLQRRLRLGYTRAARMMDILEQRGAIGPGEGAKPRDILIGK